ncbi:MAG: aminotransferase class I/II-fold pyridoxal phosphate-dependent enzyme [Oscillospiraceae bacterium]|nr:aminotransferase class I/II-fold pyridoxal phosphate-dependent enzyme [Oscillospiraceae bacterium]
MVFICNPNNPVGNVIDVELMDGILEKCSNNGIVAVVDECFMDFVEDGYSAVGKAVVIKAFTKLYAMAGMRLGYMIGDTKIINAVRNAMQSWSVSALAQITGTAALSDTEYVEKSVKYINSERDFLRRELSELGFITYNSKANYVFFKGDTKIYRSLLEKGILIRSCENFRGLDEGFYRAAVRLHEENAALIGALKELK